jgi:NADP-dependent 3-hydroxy acid dehydrogenase YdfG
MRRTWPLPVFGPRGLRQMTRHFIAAFSEDIRIRTEGLEREVPGGYRVKVHEIEPGVIHTIRFGSTDDESRVYVPEVSMAR